MSDRIEAAFLAAGIDPEFSSVIVEYRKNVYVYALVNTLALYMDKVERLQTALDTSLEVIGLCMDESCKRCLPDDPKTWRHE